MKKAGESRKILPRESGKTSDGQGGASSNADLAFWAYDTVVLGDTPCVYRDVVGETA